MNQVQNIQCEMQDMLESIRNGGNAMKSQTGSTVPSVEVDKGMSRHYTTGRGRGGKRNTTAYQRGLKCQK